MTVRSGRSPRANSSKARWSSAPIEDGVRLGGDAGVAGGAEDLGREARLDRTNGRGRVPCRRRRPRAPACALLRPQVVRGATRSGVHESERCGRPAPFSQTGRTASESNEQGPLNRRQKTPRFVGHDLRFSVSGDPHLAPEVSDRPRQHIGLTFGGGRVPVVGLELQQLGLQRLSHGAEAGLVGLGIGRPSPNPAPPAA